ncbi:MULTISPECIES: hypothetical protein [unclassified Wolbachia]|uniref:hypothetical protein n=1 Tax=unclassified Wolbachia TaxID=2640676 RepID=UPI0007EEF4A1|nr:MULTISPECIES: hypothetical protein [unclassified Wolbachia]
MNEMDFINLPLDLEQELGDGYIKLTDSDFNGYTDHHSQKGEVLDESHNVIGNFTINDYIGTVCENDHKFNFHQSRQITLEGDIEKILSLYKKI